MIRNFIKAARLRTLPLSVSGIIIGACLGNYTNTTRVDFSVLESPIFWLSILTTIGFQVLSNFANDYGDGIKGTDDNRQGEKRLVASGLISPKQMKQVMIITAIITFFTAISLVFVAFGKENFLYSLMFLILSVLSIVSAIKYTVGNSAYGYSGFGDIFVFLFFGLLAVVGTYFLYTQQLNYSVFLPACSVGLLSTAVLNLNNMRDIENDTKVGKRTLVVKIGSEFAKYYHYYLIISSFLFGMLYVVLNFKGIHNFMFVLAYIPLVKHILFVIKNNEPVKFDPELKKVALSTFLFAVLFSIGQIL